MFFLCGNIYVAIRGRIGNVRLYMKMLSKSFCTNPFELIFRYVKHHYIHQLNQTPNYDYLGHPLNAYHFIRHVASGWDNIMMNVLHDDIHNMTNDLGN